ncbi:MAG: ATP-binding protein [Marinobacterium sp.]|nr:ATP-binding protein [Marinobacterium sp.]
MTRWGSIKQQMLVVAVLPLMVFALALGVYFIQSRVADTNHSLTVRGQTIARLLAVSVEFGLLTGNREMLRSQVRAPISEEDVTELVVLDQQFSELVRRSDTLFEINRHAVFPRLEEGYGYFLAPVTTTGIAFQDLPEFSEGRNNQEIIGWVAVVMSQEPTQQHQQQIILKGILLLLGGLAGSLLLVSRSSRNIIKPVEDLTRVVMDIEAGRLWRRADDRAYGEMQVLQRGFNRMAEKVENSNSTLESQVEEQTRALRHSMSDIKRKNNELTRARERADRANQAKDEFLARMSHELRTPLTSVIGFSRMLQQSGLSNDQQEYSRIINLTSGMLLSIIDDILDFSRLESRAIRLESLPFSLCDCVREVVEMLSPVAHEKRVELVMIMDPRLPRELQGDAVRIRQILVNLISNAIKFTDRGSVTVHARPCGRGIRLEVRDTGIGIPEQQLATLFSAFVQADTSITRRYGGSGLGLAISRHLAELMGGHINLQSREGEGTQVWLDLELPVLQGPMTGPLYPCYRKVLALVEHPQQRLSASYLLMKVATGVVCCSQPDEFMEHLRKDSWECVMLLQSCREDSRRLLKHQASQARKHHDGELVVITAAPIELPTELNARQLRKPLASCDIQRLSRGEASPVNESARGSSLARPIRILVAEDNNFNRLLLRRVLEQAGAEVFEVITGVEAVFCAKEYAPDLILMDVHMPEMDGIEATHLIRQQGYSQPILALTANVVEREHDVLYKAGVDEVLLKPIEDRVLIARLNDYVIRDQTRRGYYQEGQVSRELITGPQSDTQESMHNEATDQPLSHGGPQQHKGPQHNKEPGHTQWHSRTPSDTHTHRPERFPTSAPHLLENTEADTAVAELDTAIAEPPMTDISAKGVEAAEGLVQLLARYQISPQAFTDELTIQQQSIERSLRHLDRTVIRHHTHQLVGLAGLYELPELEEVSQALNQAAHEGSARDLWQQCWRLQRIIRQILVQLC